MEKPSRKTDPSTLTKRQLYIQEYNANYMKSEKGRKHHIIKNWKRIGIKCDNYDEMYKIYMECDECFYCGKSFKQYEEGYNYDKHLDHDHEIYTRENVRGILCRICNLNDVLDDLIQI